MKRLSPHLTYANVIATLALFLALGGGAYAAIKLPKNSVGAKQIKSNAVGSAEIRSNAVGTVEVKPGSLLANDFGAGQLPSGPRGLTGLTGPRGLTGLTGPAGRSALSPLRSGETVRGTWSVSGGQPSGGSSEAVGAISLPIPAPVPIDSAHAVIANNDTQTGDGCTGTAAAPVAAPGYLCAYGFASSGTTFGSAYGARSNLASPSGGGTGDGTTSGIMVDIIGDGNWNTRGTWAYRAP